MSNDDEDVLDSVFHGCALAAYLDQAVAEQGWPSSEATRVRAYRYYEDALAEKNGRTRLDPPLELYRTIQTRKDGHR